jgi:hypothetical protein
VIVGDGDMIGGALYDDNGVTPADTTSVTVNETSPRENV